MVFAEYGDRACVAASVALEDLDRRRLSRPVRAQEPEDLAGADLEADSSDGLDPAVVLAQIVDYDRHIWQIC